ncbi:MAG: alpha/beta fold hydrolase [Candidatus Lambdaproteobacteria bacterium]|nr:alpha/beta fold hydrolase [Candidatus Lambdaproteobacteria bacterium]
MKLSTHKLPVSDGESIVLDFVEPERPSGGRTAVFVHGFGSNRRGEKALYFASRFAEAGWHFMALDMRGHGESEGSMLRHAMSRCLADLSKAMDWLPRRLEPPILIGSSMGGAVSSWYNLLNPGRCRALVLIAPSLVFPRHYEQRLTPAELEEWRRTGSRVVKNEWVDIEVGYSVVEDGRKYDPDRLAREHDAPTLIFHGLQDTAVDWHGSVAFLEKCPLPNIKLMLIKDGDHRLTNEKEILFETMAGWIRGLYHTEEVKW